MINKGGQQKELDKSRVIAKAKEPPKARLKKSKNWRSFLNKICYVGFT